MKSSNSDDQRLDFWPGGLRAPSLHKRSRLQAILREQRESRFICRRGVLAVKEGFLPILDAIRKDRFGKDRVQATLKSYSAALQKRTPRGLRLGVAIEELEPEI